MIRLKPIKLDLSKQEEPITKPRKYIRPDSIRLYDKELWVLNSEYECKDGRIGKSWVMYHYITEEKLKEFWESWDLVSDPTGHYFVTWAIE